MIRALETDLYQLTMAAGYWAGRLAGPATFELFVRRLPEPRGYLVACGLDEALDALESLRFTTEERAWLAALPQFARVPRAFFDEYLAAFRFTGDVWAMPEGTPVFANEPILRVTAPLPEAQVVETAMLAIVTFQTSVASKASRIVEAAEGRRVVEFGARRAHGIGAALAAARAAFIGGCDGTSFVEAARRYGIPPSGTMAHAWIQAAADEVDAFRTFERHFGEAAVFLLDTYDTVSAARRLVASGLAPRTVRIDSGDLDALSREVRRIFDDAGLRSTQIFATSDLDEYRIRDLVAARAPIDGFGVGTALTTVADAPALSGVYKLVEVDRHGVVSGVIKTSEGKQTWPGPKQVWRRLAGGRAEGDVLAGIDEPGPEDATPLLAPVMKDGRRLQAPASLAVHRAWCRRTVGSLPPGVRRIDAPDRYPVSVSDTLEARRLALEHRLRGR